MATMGEEELEYESDPEEAKRSLAMRRREAACDDEEGEREEANNTEARVDRRAVIHSDESDGQGGAADYDDDEEELNLEEDEEVEEVYDEEEGEFDDDEAVEIRKGELQGNVERTGEDVKEAVVVDGNRNVDEGVEINNNDNNHVGEEGEEGEGEEEKKENEPFAVPTAGTFYMHDDRFRDNVGARQRRTHGGRRLWESKDNGKWGHDKFEEMNLLEKHYEQGGRSSQGRYRARSKNRDPDSGYPRGSRPKSFGKSNNQNHASKAVRGRGPRRYGPTMRQSSHAPPTQNKLSGKPRERTSQANSSRAFIPETNADTATVPARKHIVESSLSSASPPFYPSGSSNKDMTSTQEKDMQAGSISRKLHPSVTDENFSVSQSNSLHGKNVLDSLSMAKLYIDDSSMSASVKPLTNVQLGNTGQPSHSRVQGRGVAIPGQKTYQPAPHHNQVNRGSPPTQMNSDQRSSVQGRALSSAAKQLGQHPGIGSQASSPPKTAMSFSSYESGEVESSETTGDQNFPAFLPVMQFGGQHPGGLSVPAVGMAFPGYVAQPQLGRGNSEMTWLPVLTGAAGALGATYCPPYIAVDGSYHGRPSGQTSSTGSSSKENTSNKPNNEWKPSHKTELVNDEFGQRQNNPNKQPRRYSEMSFSKPFFFALCDLQILTWNTLGCNLFRDSVVICDKHLLMLHSVSEYYCGLTGGILLFKCAVFLVA
ncbi:hypothetical protein V6N12_071473 [Hibiscus sabdariffa]|uniref:Btz domain-containing protein n=1 Tax=Hibiscus sabdariffa TaxID=183260 RepID=A0ABR2FJV9_9ROSI